MGGKVQEMAFVEGITVKEALSKSGQSFTDGYEIVLNGTARTIGIIDSKLKDKDIILIQKKSIRMISVKVARVKEKIQEIRIPEGSTIEKALMAAGRLPFTDEDIWEHFGDSTGIKRGISDKVLPGCIYILEPRNNLRSKISRIVRDTFEDYNGEWEDGINQICGMLKNDYNIE